ncbi:MAG: DUF2914 domain-containing protein [Candidatus Margulisbacteria bacterium]|nr:DUF2914 domain-containing protein [Candidatus Margulisiibacteriota bacterium]
MVRFTGYAKKREPKWPYAVMALIIILVAVIVISIASAIAAWLESEINNRSAQAPVASSTSVTSSTSALPTSTGPKETTKTTAAPATITEKPTGLRVDKLIIASGVDESNRPVDDLSKISVNECNTVYCYTRLVNSGASQVIRHVWLAPSGRVAAEIELSAHGGATDTYSYVSIGGLKTGQWEVRVETKAGEVLAKRSFATY